MLAQYQGAEFDVYRPACFDTLLGLLVHLVRGAALKIVAPRPFYLRFRSAGDRVCLGSWADGGLKLI